MVRDLTSINADLPLAVRPALRTVGVGLLGLTTMLLLLGWMVTEPFEPLVASWDDSLARWLVDRRNSVTDAIASTASELGHTTTIVVGALGFCTASLCAGRPRAAFVVAVGLLMELTVFLVVNTLIARPRPTLSPLGSVPSTHSFPSGHAAAAVVLYGGITFFAAAALSPGVWRRVVSVVGLTVALSVGVARVYAAVHHPTDVLAGWLVGFACLGITLVAVGIVAVRPRSSTWSRADQDTRSGVTL